MQDALNLQKTYIAINTKNLKADTTININVIQILISGMVIGGEKSGNFILKSILSVNCVNERIY